MNSNDHIILIAKKILNRELGVIAGAKELASMRDYFIKVPSLIPVEDFEILLDIEFDATNLPLEDIERSQWNVESLKQKDIEIHQLEAKYQNAVFTVCQNLIEKLS